MRPPPPPSVIRPLVSLASITQTADLWSLLVPPTPTVQYLVLWAGGDLSGASAALSAALMPRQRFTGTVYDHRSA